MKCLIHIDFIHYLVSTTISTEIYIMTQSTWLMAFLLITTILCSGSDPHEMKFTSNNRQAYIISPTSTQTNQPILISQPQIHYLLASAQILPQTITFANSVTQQQPQRSYCLATTMYTHKDEYTINIMLFNI